MNIDDFVIYLEMEDQLLEEDILIKDPIISTREKIESFKRDTHTVYKYIKLFGLPTRGSFIVLGGGDRISARVSCTMVNFDDLTIHVYFSETD